MTPISAITHPYLSAPDLTPGAAATIVWGSTTIACTVTGTSTSHVAVRLAKSGAHERFARDEVITTTA